MLYAVHFAALLPHPLQKMVEVTILCLMALYGLLLLALLFVLGWYTLARLAFPQNPQLGGLLKNRPLLASHFGS